MSEELVLLNKQGALAEILLNRPKSLNALSLAMIQQMKSVLLNAFADPDIKSIWISSTTNRSFCAGGDVKALIQHVMQSSVKEEHRTLGQTYFTQEYELDLLIESSPKPIVIFGQGLIYGGGWGLFAGANLRLTSSNAQLCMPEIQIGFFADVGAAAYLQKNNWKAGTFLALTGIAISAEEALALNYLDGIISSDYADTLKKQLISGLDVTELDIDSTIDCHSIAFNWKNALAQLPDEGPLSDWMTVIRQESTDIFKRAVASMVTGSPWSTAFNWHYFRRTRSSTREQVLEAEAEIGARFCAEADFIEGVNCKLIEKAREPEWRHPHVESISIEEIEQMFI